MKRIEGWDGWMNAMHLTLILNRSIHRHGRLDCFSLLLLLLLLCTRE